MSRRRVSAPRSGYRAVAGLVLSTLLGAPGLPAGELPDPAADGLTLGERFAALVARAGHEQGQIRTLEARFVQRKESEMLLEPEESQGTFSFQAPDRIRWDFTSPSAMTLVIRERQMITWYRDLNRVEQLTISRQAERFLRLLGPASSLRELQPYFTLSASFPEIPGEPYQVRLEPLSARIGKRIREMTIRLDPTLFLPIYLRYVEAGGDATELRFEALRINQGIPEERFEIALPEGVERVRVGDGKAGGR